MRPNDSTDVRLAGIEFREGAPVLRIVSRGGVLVEEPSGQHEPGEIVVRFYTTCRDPRKTSPEAMLNAMRSFLDADTGGPD